MSTNYTARFDACSHCSRGIEAHIGKLSNGGPGQPDVATVRLHPWPDEGAPEIYSWSDWQQVLSRGDALVFDEYGQQVADVETWLARWTPRDFHTAEQEYIDDAPNFSVMSRDPAGFVCISTDFS